MIEKKKSKAVKKTTAVKKKTTKVVKKAAEQEPVDKQAEETVIISSEVEVRKAPVAAAANVQATTRKKIVKRRSSGVPTYYGTGRRKEATARVFLQAGKGQITVNGREFSEYFCNRKVLEFKARRPLVVTNNQELLDVNAETYGGGVPGQADAISLGIARALLKLDPSLRIKLKREGLLKRDPRMKERKKYGLKGARRAFQYTKR